MSSKIADFDDFIDCCGLIDTNGYNLKPYRSLLELARSHSNKIRLFAGFMPWSYAQIALEKGVEYALTQAILR